MAAWSKEDALARYWSGSAERISCIDGSTPPCRYSSAATTASPEASSVSCSWLRATWSCSCPACWRSWSARSLAPLYFSVACSISSDSLSTWAFTSSLDGWAGAACAPTWAERATAVAAAPVRTTTRARLGCLGRRWEAIEAPSSGQTHSFE